MRGVKRIIFVLLTVLMLFGLSGCCLKHNWVEASCEAPKTCTKCGITEGEPLGHEWNEATCEAPKTCARCGKTEGEPLGHEWNEATCEAPKTCARCGKTEGEALGHTWLENTPNYQQPKTCEVCGKTEGEPLEAVWSEWNNFAELDKYYDYNTQWMGLFNEPGRIEEYKVRFSNYRVFESDEEHESKDGYEYRAVDLEQMDNVEDSGIGAGFIDYYIDSDFFVEDGLSVNWMGETYEAEWWYEKNEEKGYRPEYAEFGWKEDGAYHYVCYTLYALVPVGYDGLCVYTYDSMENDELYADYQGEDMSYCEWLETLENVLVFRMN